MQTIFTILLAILAFGVLVVGHEFGHFITAKTGGIQVNEFWIGMGPTLFSKEYHGTLYCLKLLPFGGACVMEGEDGESDNPYSFGKASIPRRALVVVAGALMNFIIGFIIVLGLLLPNETQATTTIASFEEGFSYQGEQMLQTGDQLLKIDGYHIWMTNDISVALARGSNDLKYDIVVRRDGKKLFLPDVPLSADFVTDSGVKYYGINFATQEMNLLTHIQSAAYMSMNYARLVWHSLGDLISGQVGVDQLSGPVGVANVMSQAAQQSMRDFFVWVAFISINLGVMNLLPLPALDGGRLVFIIIEAIRRKPVPPKYEGFVHGAGLALLMLLMLYVTGHDILRLITGNLG